MNEVEATAKKAARGAGYPWGMAEEAAKATRWLCERSFDGCAALAALLSELDGREMADRASLCPLTAGTSMADRQVVENIGTAIQPILLLPFAAQVAARTKTPVTLSWATGSISTDGNAASTRGATPAQADETRVCSGGALDAPSHPATRANPSPKDWATLNRFAHRTYAPATEESRLKGAGAGTSDND